MEEMMPSSSNASKKPQKSKAASGAPALTKERIITKAIEIIGREGLDNFSMRNIAKALGVYPTAIYWHIPGKNALLGEIVGEVLKDLAPSGEQKTWQNWFRTLFMNYRKQVRLYPNVAPLIGVQLVSNASVDFDLIEQILTTLTNAGFSPEKIPAAYNAVIGVMVGYATQEFALVPSDDQVNWQEAMRKTINSINNETHPQAAHYINKLRNNAFILRWENGVTAPLDDGFELYVDMAIAGLETLAAKKD